MIKFFGEVGRISALPPSFPGYDERPDLQLVLKSPLV
jgi:hypothetical protein